MMIRIRNLSLGIIAIMVSLWVAHNALNQTRITRPGETMPEAIRALILGRPELGSQICPAFVHDRYTTTGPDGKKYPTWHPSVDPVYRCYFDHEHGSDPHSYIGFAQSGLPAFGYTAAQAGIQESHAGYKVYVTNNDLNGHAWMILLNQDTSTPQRALTQFYTVDWHISSLDGKPLANLHLLGDFGYAYANCEEAGREPIPGDSIRGDLSQGQHREILTTTCAPIRTYENWAAWVHAGDVFGANPIFDIDNPITAVDVNHLSEVLRTCEFGPHDFAGYEEPCVQNGDMWLGNRRGIVNPGQDVHNNGSEYFFTDAFGDPVSAGIQGAIQQYVTSQGWNNRICCGYRGINFHIQTFSEGVYIAKPKEEPGSAEFGYGLPVILPQLNY
ncbi:MAG: hypothetical protein ACM3PY_21120 [Omnitrophica WOR_2 bacterium]